MANDIDMWNDIEELERKGDLIIAGELHKIYTQKFINGNDKKAEKLKQEFIQNNGYWEKYF